MAATTGLTAPPVCAAQRADDDSPRGGGIVVLRRCRPLGGDGARPDLRACTGAGDGPP